MTPDELWKNEFGQRETARDFTGKPVRCGDYGKEQSPTGWNYDHIEPLNLNGYDNIANVQIVNIATNREKEGKTSFSIDGIQYQVVRNTPKKTNGKQPAPYNYEGKKYCIVILDK